MAAYHINFSPPSASNNAHEVRLPSVIRCRISWLCFWDNISLFWQQHFASFSHIIGVLLPTIITQHAARHNITQLFVQRDGEEVGGAHVQVDVVCLVKRITNSFQLIHQKRCEACAAMRWGNGDCTHVAMPLFVLALNFGQHVAGDCTMCTLSHHAQIWPLRQVTIVIKRIKCLCVSIQIHIVITQDVCS